MTGVSASGVTTGILPGSLGTAELMAFFHIDSVVKAAGSSTGTINTTFSAPDLAFDYLAAGEHLNITYAVQLDDHAGGVSTQNVVVTVIGTNDKPVYLSGPETAHLVEDQNVNSSGNLHANGDLFFTDIDLSDTHSVSTAVSATVSGGGPVPISDAALLAAFTTSLEDSTGHLLGEVDWNFAMQNAMAGLLGGGQTLTATYHVTVVDSAGASAVQDVTITILGTNHPVMITSGPESSTVSGSRRYHRLRGHRHHADRAGGNASFHRCRHRRYPLGCGVACFDVRRGCPGGDASRSCGGADHDLA